MTKKSRAAGGTPATELLSRSGVDFTLHPYDHDPAVTDYGEEAVAAIGGDARRIFKTLIVSVPGRPERLVVAVLPVARRLDLKAMGAAVGAKRVELAEPALAQRSSGYVLGGISPLGQRTALPTVLDASALDFPTIFLSAGKRGLEVELRPHDLIGLTGATVSSIGH